MAEDNSASKNRRGQLWISPKVQSYMVIHGIIFGAYFLIIYGLSEYFFYEKFRIGIETSHPQDTADLLMYLNEYQWSKVLFVAGSSALVLILSGLQMLYVSHRVCGPIFKMTKLFDEMAASGKTGEVKLRDKDFFGELAVSINRLFNTFELKPKRKD